MQITKYCDELWNYMFYEKRHPETTCKSYNSEVKKYLYRFNDFYAEPKRIPQDKIKEYIRSSISVSQLKNRISALKYFYTYIIRQPLKFRYVEYPKQEQRLPDVMEHEELISKINAIENIKHRMIISLGYCCGLRVSEVCNLKIIDVDESRMMVKIIQGKGKKDRVAPISENIIKLLYSYIEEYNPTEYLFNGESKNSLKYSTRSCEEIIKKYLGNYGFHVLRHSAFTQMVDNDTNLAVIQRIAGHQNIRTTQHYCHISTKILSKVKLPI